MSDKFEKKVETPVPGQAQSAPELTAPPIRPPLHNTSAPRDKEPVGIDRLVKWQEERVARRLKGEYESVVMHLSEVVSCSFRRFQGGMLLAG